MTNRNSSEWHALMAALGINNYLRQFDALPDAQRPPIEEACRCEGAAPILRVRANCKRFVARAS